MKIYINTGELPHLVRAALSTDGTDYRVHSPDAGYSIWPADQFDAEHRALTRREAQLVNHTVGELEVMAISDQPDPAELVAVMDPALRIFP